MEEELKEAEEEDWEIGGNLFENLKLMVFAFHSIHMWMEQDDLHKSVIQCLFIKRGGGLSYKLSFLEICNRIITSPEANEWTTRLVG